MNTSPSAIARIIKRDAGFSTVPWGRLGLSVTTGAISGSVYVESNFPSETTSRNRMDTVVETLRAKGYDVRVTSDGIAAHVSK